MIKILSIILTVAFANVSQAAFPVNSSQTITHRVLVNPIIVEKTTGERATFLGVPSQSKNIRESVKLILSQVGIDVHFLPAITWVNDFAFDASPNTPASGQTRSTSDFFTIRNNSSAPKHGDPEVINLFFLKLAPGSNTQSVESIRGYGIRDFNGGSIQVGANLLTFPNGRDTVALSIAQEICRNLGLSNTSAPDNLMNASSDSGKLTQTQKNTIFTDFTGFPDGFDFAKPIASNANEYSSWSADNGLTGGVDDDDDNDGFSNFFEFCCGLDPKNEDGDRFSSIKLPLNSTVVVSLPKQPDALAAGVTYQIQSSSTLGQWKSNGEAGSAMTLISDNNDVVTVELNQVTTGSRFYRYNFVQN